MLGIPSGPGQEFRSIVLMPLKISLIENCIRGKLMISELSIRLSKILFILKLSVE